MVNLPRGRNGPWIPKTAFRSSPRASTAAAPSGVFVAKAPNTIVLVRGDVITPTPPIRWPYYASVVAQPNQPFHFLLNSVVPPRLEPESITPPAQVYWPWSRFAQPFQPLLIWANSPIRTVDAEALAPVPPSRWPYYVPTVAQPNQSFHFLLNSVPSPRLEAEIILPSPPAYWPYKTAINQSFHFLLNSVASPRLEPEVIAPSPLVYWPWNRFAQPFQPLLIWANPPVRTVDAEVLTPMPPSRWPYYVSTAAQPNQSFHFLFNSVASPRLEAEIILPSPPAYWPWNRFAQPFQPLLIWANPPIRTVDAEALAPVPPGQWPYYAVAATQPRQSFHFLLNSAIPPKLEVESIAPSPPVYWPWNRATPFRQQSFSFLLNANKTVIIDPEAPPPAGVNPRFPSWSIVVTYGNIGTGGSPIDSG